MQPELIARAAHGDAEAFAEIARAAAPRLYAIACRILRDPDRADDALQATLIAIWNDLASLRDPTRFDAWSCRLLVRAAYHEARRDRRWTSSVRLIRTGDTAPDHAQDVAVHDQLERGFRRLSPEHRAVLVLHYFEGLPANEVAETLGIPVGTATSRIHYATRQLRAALEADARGAGVLERTI